MRRIAIVCLLCLSATASVAWGSTRSSITHSHAGHNSRVIHKHARHKGRGHKHKRTVRKPSRTHSPARRTTAAATGSVLFGDQAVERTVSFDTAGLAEAFPFSSQSAATVTSIRIYVDSHNSARTLFAGLYADNGGHPGSLLAAGSVSYPSRGAWDTVTLRSTSVSAGSTYCVAVLGRYGTLFFRDRTGGPCNSETSAQLGLSALPSSWTSGQQWNTCPISAYAVGKVSSTDPPPTTTTTTSSDSPPPPAGPTAAFTDSPSSPVTGQSAHFNASGSTCSATPCSYAWADDPPGGGTWPFGSSQSVNYAFSDAGTKYTVLTVTDANGRSATVEHDVVVSATAPTAPSNTALPQISGTTTQGDTLTSSNGSWTGSPTGYSYNWQDCNGSGAGCTGISGAADANSYTLTSGDVGHTVRVVVTASNGGGSASATSGASAAIAAASSGGGGGGTQTNCIANPSACGYPDATNSGVPAGTQLTSSGSITAGTPGETISDLSVNGTITVTANNVTIKDTKITTGNGQLNGVSAIMIQSGVSGTVVEDTTMQGSNCQGGSLFAGVMNESGDQLTMERDYGTCLDDILHGSGTLADSYWIDNANIPSDHYEPVAYDGGAGSITINHNTLLNPHDQTAAVFVTCWGGPVTSETITNNLMAGGDYVVYGPTGNGGCSFATGPQTVTGNRFSTIYYSSGGQYGLGVYFESNQTTWSGNIWDNNGASAGM